MRANHKPHESQTGKGRKPSDTPTARELEFVRALDGIHRAGVAPSNIRLAAWLGVTGSTACFLRDAAIARGLVHSSGYGSTRKLTITATGRQALDHANG